MGKISATVIFWLGFIILIQSVLCQDRELTRDCASLEDSSLHATCGRCVTINSKEYTDPNNGTIMAKIICIDCSKSYPSSKSINVATDQDFPEYPNFDPLCQYLPKNFWLWFSLTLGFLLIVGVSLFMLLRKKLNCCTKKEASDYNKTVDQQPDQPS